MELPLEPDVVCCATRATQNRCVNIDQLSAYNQPGDKIATAIAQKIMHWTRSDNGQDWRDATLASAGYACIGAKAPVLPVWDPVNNFPQALKAYQALSDRVYDPQRPSARLLFEINAFHIILHTVDHRLFAVRYRPDEDGDVARRLAEGTLYVQTLFLDENRPPPEFLSAAPLDYAKPDHSDWEQQEKPELSYFDAMQISRQLAARHWYEHGATAPRNARLVKIKTHEQRSKEVLEASHRNNKRQHEEDAPTSKRCKESE